MARINRRLVGGILALGIAGLVAAVWISSGSRNQEVVGAWRGYLEFERPDGETNDLYFRLTVRNLFGVLGGSAGAYQIGLGEDIDAASFADGVFAFEIPFKGEAARFEGRIEDGTLIGLLTSVQGPRALRLEHVNTSFGTDPASARAGLYEFEDGGELLLAQWAWGFSVHDLSSFDYRKYFPRSENEYYAGPASLISTPIQSRLTFSEDEDGVRLTQTFDDSERTGRLSTRIHQEEIDFQNGDVTLTGLLIRPSDAAHALPGTVVVWGSGRQTRIGFDALPYFRAVWLARHGFATLIYDKRGVGDSTGSYEERTNELLAGDMAAAIDFLAARPEVDSERVGILVHSQSGIYAPITILQSDNLSFAAVISGSVVNGEVQEIARTGQQLRADGWPQSDVADAVETQTLKFRYAATRTGWDDYIAAYHRVADREWFDSVIGSHIDQDDTVWDFWRNWNSFEPADLWREVNVPVLYLTGDRDVINPTQANLDALRGAFEGDRERLLTVRIYEGAEHSLFEAQTGSVLEEAELARMVPYMDDVLVWLEEIGMAQD